jgi:drug/metabolite transporter (DMT)-like permease
MLASATILREKVGRSQWLGASLVTLGVAIVAGTA